MVGHRIVPKIQRYGILAIVDIAQASTDLLHRRLGKVSLMYQLNALGEDNTPVMPVGMESAIKSVGNSTITPRDMTTLEDVRCVYDLLTESVTARLLSHGLMSRCVSIHARDAQLNIRGCQQTIGHYTILASDITVTAMQLFLSRECALLPNGVIRELNILLDNKIYKISVLNNIQSLFISV